MGNVPLIPEIVPSSGIAGPDGAAKGHPRADFQVKRFNALIETKGYRLAWSRASECPCSGVNDQTKQPDPNCTLCKGKGWFYFAPTEAVVSDNVGPLNPLQTALVAALPAGVIRGVISGIHSERFPYGEIGNWHFGDVMVTVRPENRIGYYDKLVHLDSEIVFAEGITTASLTTLATRYPVNQVNLLRSKTATFVATTDFTLSAGVVSWVTGRAPAVGTRVVIHYLTHPTWLVIDHPHAIRSSLDWLRVKAPLTPQGDPLALPLQAHARLEFVP